MRTISLEMKVKTPKLPKYLVKGQLYVLDVPWPGFFTWKKPPDSETNGITNPIRVESGTWVMYLESQLESQFKKSWYHKIIYKDQVFWIHDGAGEILLSNPSKSQAFMKQRKSKKNP